MHHQVTIEEAIMAQQEEDQFMKRVARAGERVRKAEAKADEAREELYALLEQAPRDFNRSAQIRAAGISRQTYYSLASRWTR